MPDIKSKNLNTIRAGFMRRASAPHVNPLAFKLAYLIAFKHMDSETGTTRVSQKQLARELGIKDSKWADRQVHRLLDILKPLGLVIVHGNGRGQTATYWIDPDKVERGTPESGFKTDERGTPESGFTTERGTPDNRKGDKYHPKRGTPESAPLKKNLQEESPRVESIYRPPDFASRDSGDDAPWSDDRFLQALRDQAHATRVVWATVGNVRIDSGDDDPRETPKAVAARIRMLAPKLSREDQETLRQRDRQQGTGIWTNEPKPKASGGNHYNKNIGVRLFPDFWAAYPKRVAKAQAEKAFAAAIKRGADPADLIAGAKRYASERTGQDPKFTKHPATWINAECWLDESASAGPVTIDNITGHVIDTPAPRRRSQEEIDAEAKEQILADNEYWSPRR